MTVWQIIILASIAVLAIKLVGAGYLLWLAVQLWRAPTANLSVDGTPVPATSLWRLARQEFWVAAGNPKAILIFTAFLPQFVTPGPWASFGALTCVRNSLISFKAWTGAAGSSNP